MFRQYALRLSQTGPSAPDDQQRENIWIARFKTTDNRGPRRPRAIWILVLAFACVLPVFFYVACRTKEVTCTRLEVALVNCVTEEKALGLLPTGEPRTFTAVRYARYVHADCDDDTCPEWIDVYTAKGQERLITLGFLAPAGIVEQINALTGDPTKTAYHVVDYSGLAAPIVLAILAASMTADRWRRHRHVKT